MKFHAKNRNLHVKSMKFHTKRRNLHAKCSSLKYLSHKNGWKNGIPLTKIKRVRRAIAKAMQLDENASEVTAILNIAKTQKEY